MVSELVTTEILPAEISSERSELPPITVGHESAIVERKVRTFYLSVADIFETWLGRTENYHTKRSYRRDVLNFIEFVSIRWPENSWELLKTSTDEVQRWRNDMQSELGLAPKTINRRISSLSGFFEFLRGSAEKAKLPIMLHNPAHKDFIKRPVADPVTETKALSMENVRRLLRLPRDNEVLDFRDRAILKFYAYSGARILTGCRLEVADFWMDEEDPAIDILEKGHGDSKRRIGLHHDAAEAIHDYIREAGITSGPLFRARLNSRSEKLGKRPIQRTAMYQLLTGYLQQLPRAMKEIELADGTTKQQCIYTPHSLRATTATLLLKSGVDIAEVQELLGHKHVTTTQIYDKRIRQTRDSASHKVPF